MDMGLLVQEGGGPAAHYRLGMSKQRNHDTDHDRIAAWGIYCDKL